MANFNPDHDIPRTVNPDGFCRNGKVPSAQYVMKCARSTNHIVAYRKKHIFTHGRDLANVVAASGSTRDFGYAYCWTGYGTTKIDFQVGIQFSTSTAGNSRVAIVVTRISDSSIQTIYFYTGSLNAAHSTDTVNRINWVKKGVTVVENEAYGIEIEEQNYARAVAVSAFEVGALPVNSTTTGGVNESFAATGSPILDSDVQDLTVSQTSLWKRNSSQLAWYSGDASFYSYNSTTYKNVVDRLATSVASTSPGWTFDLSKHHIKSQTTVPVRIAALAQRSSGGGTVGNNKVRFINSSGDNIEITGINARAWYTVDGTLPKGSGADKYDLQLRTDASDTILLVAACLLCYE